MVNTGKPSRGCYMCRARRIKCDEGKPDCMRCIKSKRVCPGYRDAFELKLRDENKFAKKKQLQARRSSQSRPSLEDVFYPPSSFINQPAQLPLHPISDYGRSHTPHSRSSSGSSSSSHIDAIRNASAMARYRDVPSFVSRQITTPIHQQAACFFLANFVLVPEAGTMRGYLDFIIPLLKRPKPAQTLSLAFSAVAFAALGTRPNSKLLLSKAGMWYLKALKEINAALQDPTTASSNSTIASVMLMAVFEQLTPSRMKVGGWASHIDGAVALIKSRRKDQWEDSVSRELFIAVRAHMTIHCIANSKHADPAIDWLGVQAQDNIIQSFAAINLKMASLRANNEAITSLKEHTPENIEKVLKLLQAAKTLDQEYIDWIEALPANWAINTVAWIDGNIGNLANSIVHPGRVDAYEQLWIAYKYNVVRACRLNIWVTILRCIAWIGESQDYRLTPEFTTAKRVCGQIVEDVVASVPYFFGWNRDRNIAMADRSNFACGTNDFTTVKPLVGIFAMWPLFTASTSDFASPSQTLFLKGRLKHIAEIMGINQAWIMFQAQLRSPSMYIMRERLKIPVGNCSQTDSLEAKVERLKSQSPPRELPVQVPITPITPVSPPRQQNWIPKSLQESQLIDDGMAKSLLYNSTFTTNQDVGVQIVSFQDV